MHRRDAQTLRQNNTHNQKHTYWHTNMHNNTCTNSMRIAHIGTLTHNLGHSAQTQCAQSIRDTDTHTPYSFANICTATALHSIVLHCHCDAQPLRFAAIAVHCTAYIIALPTPLYCQCIHIVQSKPYPRTRTAYTCTYDVHTQTHKQIHKQQHNTSNLPPSMHTQRGQQSIWLCVERAAKYMVLCT